MPDPPTDPQAPTEAAPLATPDGAGAPAPMPARATASDDAAPVLAGRYEILGMLGAGAMGTVYRARDRELDEIVALKMLRRELAAAPGMIERFRREVKLARRVTHRNVARTFDIGEHGGDRFLTMELVDGDMLGAIVARRGALTALEALRIAADICAGLSAAHAAGVLHRDLKPENVVVARDGRVVITDFGIARALAGAELARSMSGFVGTPAYMAPEQIEGSPDLDERADLYALGAMFFEMLTGELAWNGQGAFAVAAARLLREPPDVRERPRGRQVPAAVAEIVTRLMARQRDARFASADAAGAAITALLAELSTTTPGQAGDGAGADVATAPRASTEKSIAVLPLVNLGGAADEYLAQGVTEDLVDLLSASPGLRVRPRGAAARFDAPTRDVREAGRVLGVDVVVDGSVRRHGDTTRVAVRLVTVADGFQLWAKRFDRMPGELLAVADDAAAAIARALTAEPAAVGARAPMHPAAQDLYLRGRSLLHRAWSEVVVGEAADILAEAHRIAPDDARVTGLYALVLARTAWTGNPAIEGATGAREAVERALARDPEQPEARTALGLLHWSNLEGVAAVTELERALSAAPNAVDALDALGALLSGVGETERGDALLALALAIEPGMFGARVGLARTRALLGDRDGFVRCIGEMPSHVGDAIMWLMANAREALWNRDGAKAEALLARVAGLELPRLAAIGLRGTLDIAIRGGLSDENARLVAEHLPLDGINARRAAFNATMRAEFFAASERDDEALGMLRKADTLGLFDRVWLERNPLFARLRDVPVLVRITENVAARAERVARAAKTRS